MSAPVSARGSAYTCAPTGSLGSGEEAPRAEAGGQASSRVDGRGVRGLRSPLAGRAGMGQAGPGSEDQPGPWPRPLESPLRQDIHLLGVSHYPWSPREVPARGRLLWSIHWYSQYRSRAGVH